MAAKRKTLTLLVTISVPHWCSAAQARRETRDMLNCENLWWLNGPDGQEGRLRAKSVRPAPAVQS